jgi:hypothetical protein
LHDIHVSQIGLVHGGVGPDCHDDEITTRLCKLSVKVVEGGSLGKEDDDASVRKGLGDRDWMSGRLESEIRLKNPGATPALPFVAPKHRILEVDLFQ